jgi:hypothetical protein
MTSTRSSVSKDKLYNFDQLKDMYPGNEGFLKHFADIFLKITPYDCSEMMAATIAGDWQKASRYAHKMKSTIDSMNITSIKTEIRTVEMDAKNKTNTSSLLKVAQKIEKVINEVALQVKEDYNL